MSNASWLAIVCVLAACDLTDEVEPVGSGGSISDGQGGAGNSGNPASGGSGGGASGTGGDVGGQAGEGGSGAQGGSGGLSGSGWCEVRGKAAVTTTSYSGSEEYVLLTGLGKREELCVVRFETERSGQAPPGCVNSGTDACSWTHTVKFTRAEVLVDVAGACARSQVFHGSGLSAAEIEKIVGSEEGRGYAVEPASHTDSVLRFDAARNEWIPWAGGVWDSMREIQFYAATRDCRYELQYSVPSLRLKTALPSGAFW